MLVLLTVLLSGRIEVSSEGVLSRNEITERWYPWGAIERFEPTMRVTVVHSDGGRSNCWAVQRANIAAISGRESRVDRVVAELEKARDRWGVGDDSSLRPTARFVRFTMWEWLQVLALVPTATILGELLFG